MIDGSLSQSGIEPMNVQVCSGENNEVQCSGEENEVQRAQFVHKVPCWEYSCSEPLRREETHPDSNSEDSSDTAEAPELKHKPFGKSPR